MPFRACLLALFLMLPALAGAQQLGLVFTPPANFDSGTFGANGEKGMGFQIVKTGTGQLDGPFTVRITLPEKVSFAGSPQGAACSAAGQIVTCTINATLTDWMWGTSGVGVWIDTAADLPVPGSSTLRVTVESAQRPLPPNPACVSSGSTSQCLEVSVPHRQSQVVFASSFWQHNGVWEAGTVQTFSAGWRNTGYSQNNGTVTARFLLPPGVTYRNHNGNIPWVCSAAAPDASGQLLTCTFAYFYDGMTENFNNINVHVDVAESVAVPGPLSISGTISNAQQPAPDIALCDDAQPPLGCGYYTGIMTRPKRRSQLDIVDMQHMPATFTQQTEGQLVIGFRNIGEGAAGAMTLEVAAPAGFSFDRAIAANPAGTCSASGSAASGQIITCQFAQGLPETFSGSITLVFDVGSGAATTSVALAAIGDTTRPGPTLEACAADPDAIGCGEHAIAVDPWIFCNGFEALPRVCGLPQTF